MHRKTAATAFRRADDALQEPPAISRGDFIEAGPAVAPYLTVSPALAATAFYTSVFGAEQRAFMPALYGVRVMHCELSINGGAVMLADAFPEFGQTRVGIPGEPVTVSVSLELDTKDKVDEIFDKAIGLDLFGHRWIPNAPLG